MALEFQTIPVPLVGGVSTKPDPKMLPMQKLALLENGSFDRPGRIQKRNGYAPRRTTVLESTTPIALGQGLATYRDELLLADRSSLYSYDSTRDAWSDRGGFVSAYVTQRSVIRSTYAQTAQDSATHPSGLLVSAWEDSQGGVRYAVIDTATGVALVPDGLIDATATRPKVIALGQYVLIWYVKSTNLYFVPVSVAAPTTLGTVVTVTTGLTASDAYDATVISDRAFVAWGTSTGWSVQWMGSTLAGSSPVGVTVTAATVISVFADSLTDNAVVAWYDGTSVKAQVRDYSLETVVMATATVETLANVVSLTGTAIPGASSSLRFFYSISAASSRNYLTRTATVVGYAAATAAAYLRSVALAGKAFAYGGECYVPLAHQSTLQSTYFVADASGLVVAKILAGLGGGIPARSQLPGSNALDATRWQFSFLAKDLLTTTGGAVATLTGVSAVTLDFFDRAYSYSRAELGNGLHLGGGFISLYDGSGVVEHGFHLYPEGVTTANLDSDTGTAQSYGYMVCYEWTDNQGQIHRSAPSITVSQQKLTAIDNTHRVTVTIPTLRLTAKQSARRKVQCVVYRTIANGTVYYQATSQASPIYNDTAADTVAFTDNVTDAVLQGNPQVYSTGEVENIDPGPISGMAIHQNRIVALDSMNPLQIWWSKQVVPGSPVEFSDLFVQNIDPVGGDVIAIARMDAWLVLFKRSAIFVTSEEGPSANGNGYVFTSGQQVPSDVGCVNPRSINSGASGITFQSAKGWHLLTRSLQVQDLPDTDQWAQETPVAAHTMPGLHETRFVLDSGISLVHDDFSDQWGVHTNIAAVDSVIWRDVQAYLRPDGQVMVETPGVFNDAGSAIRLRIRSAWLQFAGLSGFQRCKTLTLLGDYLSPHSLIASIAYDFSPDPTQVVTVDATGLENPVYGADSVYGGAPAVGDSTVYGGAFPAYAWRINLIQQKCTALQITIEDSQTTPVGEGYSLSALTAHVGLKPGPRRLAAARQAG